MTSTQHEKDALRFWVEMALEANRRDHTDGIVGAPGNQRGPFLSARALAMTLMAMHDAFEACTSAPNPYQPTLAPATPGLDPVGAACAAGYNSLALLYGRQAAFFAAQFAIWKKGHALDAAAEAAGQAVADAYAVWRYGDRVHAAASPYAPAEPEYDHDEDPRDRGQGFAGVRWGMAPEFAVPRLPFKEPPGAVVPATVPSDDRVAYNPGTYYMEELHEVREFGALDSAARSPEQLVTGVYWGYDGAPGIGTPPRLYMQVALRVLDERPVAYSAREWLHALSAAAVAMADAGIQAWHYKYSPRHMLWRPVLGVRHVQAMGETPWVPYGKPATNGAAAGVGKTPNFPAYPSGHATFGAAAFEVLRNFVRNKEALTFTDAEADGIAFTFVSDEFNGANTDPVTGATRPHIARHHDSLWRAIVDNSESRIFLGVHWRMDGISRRLTTGGPSVTGRPACPGELGEHGGVALGMAIARQLASQRGFGAAAPSPTPVVPAEPVA